jgi:hypothetical protein
MRYHASWNTSLRTFVASCQAEGSIIVQICCVDPSLGFVTQQLERNRVRDFERQNPASKQAHPFEANTLQHQSKYAHALCGRCSLSAHMADYRIQCTMGQLGPSTLISPCSHLCSSLVTVVPVDRSVFQSHSVDVGSWCKSKRNEGTLATQSHILTAGHNWWQLHNQKALTDLKVYAREQ